jgi:hypothetical protein
VDVDAVPLWLAEEEKLKVLFATAKSACYLSEMLWDGLREIVGPENLVDATHCPHLHELNPNTPCGRLCGEDWDDEPNLLTNQKDFDLLVLNSCFIRDFDWHWPKGDLMYRLKPGAKVAYVEGWDGANTIEPPQVPVDAVFRREFDPNEDYSIYGAPVFPLTFAAPKRWFPGEETFERNIDIFCCFHNVLPRARQESCNIVGQMTSQYKVIVSSAAIPLQSYLDLLRRSKLCICAPGAADCSDCLRTYEAISCGAIPVFVGHPSRHREPWFARSAHALFTDSTGDLTRLMNDALNTDLEPMRERLLSWSLKHHTTEARARQMLRDLGVRV